MSLTKAKIVSLVPSWTETLLQAGVNVVGRTRFCIHPDHIIKDVPAVGGTKAIDIDKIKQLNPDYILVDKQENTKPMADDLIAAGFKLLVTDVVDFNAAEASLRELGSNLNNEVLTEFADRYSAVVSENKIDTEKFFFNCLLKGQMPELSELKQWAYVIWKNPFMVVGDSTFIAQNFKLVDVQFDVAEKYPEVSEQDLKERFCFFSSEPFPFLNSYDELIGQGFRGAVIDGEKLSWFGIRNLKFLEASVK